ncbi:MULTISPECIES: tyrosine-type recombinase/integrase [Pasteurellaceae]|uniref:tyrosine-type recombinase/integrase n=1 Tax=Pasteurellaceae TaxID=712 RepID=UPI003B75B690
MLESYYSLFNPSHSFFINKLGNQISSQSVRLLIKKYVKLANIDKQITPHTFRHTFATLLLEEDIDIKYIQNLLGHSSIVTTQIYTHVSSHKQKNILSTKHPRLKLNFRI